MQQKLVGMMTCCVSAFQARSNTPGRCLPRADDALLLVLHALTRTPRPCACPACDSTAQQVQIYIAWCTAHCGLAAGLYLSHGTSSSYQTPTAASGGGPLLWCESYTAAEQRLRSESVGSTAARSTQLQMCGAMTVVGVTLEGCPGDTHRWVAPTSGGQSSRQSDTCCGRRLLKPTVSTDSQ